MTLTSPRTLFSWIGPVFALGVTGFFLTSSVGQSQSPNANSGANFGAHFGAHFSDAKVRELVGAQSSRRTNAQMICTVSSFFSIDANEQIHDLIKVEGRGLATCKNDQGFTTEIPVSTEITAKAIGNWANAGELSFSANSSSFVVPREIGQLQDSYSVKTYGSDPDKSAFLFQGTQHDLILELKLSSSTDALQKLQVTGLTMHIDENAPDLE